MNNIFKKPLQVVELENQITKLKTRASKAEAERDILRADRDDAKAVAQMDLDNEATRMALDARELYLNTREAYLTKLAEDMKWDTIVETRPTYSVQRVR